ncbi:MAG TPA: nitrate ABC transporter, permease protein [Gammaproteobacteria bacterium]|nr:nitrate ABC transporter, permease protein [Gammaproteobacteria bacterium]
MAATIVKLATPEEKPVSASTATTPPAVPVTTRKPATPGRDRVVRFTLPLLTFAILIVFWAIVQSQFAPELPTPGAVLDRALEIFADPFRDAGPNDKGIGWQLLYSLGRVAGGFSLAVAVAIPLGFLMGMSKTFNTAWQPLIQVLRPVSPLAWLPIGLLLFKAVNPSAIFVIFITCIWPTLLNTAAGVRAIPQDYMNVARVLRLNPVEVAMKILLPAARPYILTGMRLSLGIAWMVIVAAEMLTGGIGIGFYVWDEWNNLNVASIIVAIGVIGGIGILLELAMDVVQRRFDYTAR